MGQKLLLYYKYISELKGLDGKMELARETKLPSIIAASLPDSPENIEAFKKAIEKITGKPCPTLDTNT